MQAEQAYMTGTNVTGARLDGGTDTSPDLPGSFQGAKGMTAFKAKRSLRLGLVLHREALAQLWV